MRPTIEHRFEARVQATPDATALVCGEALMSYAELNAASTRLARLLRYHGASVESIVAVDLDHALSAIVALLAIVKAGAAFVAIPPADPIARVREMLADCGTRILVTNRHRAEPSRTESLPFDGVTIQLPEDAAAIATTGSAESATAEPLAASALPALDAAGADRLFQVVYTSGSTGRPKGVLVPMTAVLHRLDVMHARYPFVAEDVALLHRPFSIIGASWDCFGPLLAGVPTIIVPHFDPAAPHVWRQLGEWCVSHVAAAPVLWDLMIEQAEREPDTWTSLRLAITGGQSIGGAFVRRWRRAFPKARLLNVYAATECVSPTAHEVTADDETAARVPAGVAFPGVRVVVADARGHAVADGEPGEICIGSDDVGSDGSCLARGYLHAPALTAERFVPDPEADTNVGGDAGANARGARLFRTGDLGVRAIEGVLHVRGRLDRQVKVHGFRIDPGDVEAALARCPLIESCAIAARSEHDTDGEGDAEGEDDRELVAYVVTIDRAPLTIASMRAWLGPLLPTYMLPSSIVTLPELPRTHSGKVDYPRLPAPPRAERLVAEIAPAVVNEAPAALAQQIARIWRDVLNVDAVAPNDDFFALGGDSLAAMRIAARLREALRIDVPVSRVLDGTTVARLARDLSVLTEAEEATRG